MNRNFNRSLMLVLKEEGGYVNNSKDPGGPTNKGVTLATYHLYIDPTGTIDDLKHITNQQLLTVYRKQYWDKISGDALPDGLDYAVFDFAVNSGPSRAKKFLQGVIGVSQDGVLGKNAMAVIAATPTDRMITGLCDSRMAWLRTLPTWKTFGRGWLARVKRVKAEGLRLAGQPPFSASATPAPAPLAPSPISSATVMAVQKRLSDLGYNPGGTDGKMGPLTKGALLSFKNDTEGLTPDDTIDDAFLTALATAKPRKMEAARANATVAEVASVVPEAKAHWWNRAGAAVVGGGTTIAGSVDYIAQATGYLQPLKEFVGDVPSYVWIIGVIVLCLGLYLSSQYGAKKATEAFQKGDRI